jgi:hypothetical protein
MVQYVLSKTGAEEKLNTQLMTIYFTSQIKGLHALVNDFGGQSIARKLVEILNENAAENGVNIEMSGQEIIISEDIKWHELENASIVLLSAARNFAIGIAGLNSVNEQMLSVDQQMNESTLKVAMASGIRKR